MINKIYEILENAPIGTEFVGAYDLAEYFYSKGIRVIPQGYWIAIKDEGYQCSICGSHFDTAEGLYCAQCGAQIVAEVEIDLIKAGIPRIAGFVEITNKNKKIWKKWRKKKFKRKVA